MPQNTASFVAHENVGAVIAPTGNADFVAHENTGVVLSLTRIGNTDAHENVGATLYMQSEPVVIHEYIIAVKLFIGWGIPISQ